MAVSVGSWVDTQRVPKNDLDRAFLALNRKLGPYNTLWNYYDGDQPLMYTAKRMKDLFKNLKMEKFVENWCAVVIDAAQDRIILKSFTTKDTKAQDLLTLNFEDLALAIEASDTHEAALVIGEAFIIVWEDGEGRPQVFYNDPRLCHLFYEASNPRQKRYGAKWWKTADGYTRLTLYYPDHLEYWRTRTANKQIKDYKSFERFNPETGRRPPAERRQGLVRLAPLYSPAKAALEELDNEIAGSMPDNPYGEVPLFHFRLERRIVKSDLTNVIPLQNAVNKLVTDMMVSAEYGAFKQRWVISNSNTEALKNAPYEIWDIPAGDGVGQQSKVGQFEATDLDNYIGAIDNLTSTIAVISRTPRHYLFGQAGDPSGEALITMEAPLNKRCAEHIAQFIPVWRDVARFMLKVQGVDVEGKDIIATFEAPETVLPKTQGEIRKLGKAVGIPLVTMLRDEGKDEAWIEQMEADKKEEREASPMLELLDGIRNQRLQGNQGG